MTSANIVIDLEKSLHSIYFDDDKGSFLQIKAFEKVKILIETFYAQSIDADKNRYDEFNPQHSNNTIFIHGERGAGKTTFLKTVLNHYRNKNHELIKVCPIPVIDPTLIETHQHILVDIVTKLVRLVNGKLKCCQDEENYHKFRNKLEQMAEGLQLLNTKEKYNQDYSDAAWFLDRALNKATSGQDLERCFHKFIDTILEILGEDLFLISIDDVDTQTNKASEVLEVLRCYLTHPKLIVLISGDLRLYSNIVRNKKQKELHEEINNEADNTKELVNHLEQQYLSKILPVNQRVQLKSLYELSEQNTIRIKDRGEIKDIIHDIIFDSLHIRREHTQSHLKFILQQPVRSVLQIIKTIFDSEKDGDKFEYPSVFKKIVFQNFIGNLVDEKVELDNLSSFQPHVNSIGHELFKTLSKHGELETGFYARPDSSYDKSGYNATKLYFSTIIANQLSGKQGISNALKLMMSGGASSNIFQTYVSNNINSSFNEYDYLNYIGLSRNENNITSLCAHFSPIILSQYHPSNIGKNSLIKKGIVSGIIRTPRQTRKETINQIDAFLDKYDINNKRRISTLSSLRDYHENDKSFDIKNYIAAKTILFSSHSIITTTEGRDYISAYGLIAAIAEILEIKNGDYDKITAKIYNLTNISNYTYPKFISGQNILGSDEDSSNDNEEPFTVEVGDETETKNSIILNSFIKSWVHNIPTLNASSLLIGKIWSRMHYALNQVSETARGKVTYSEGESYDIVIGVIFSRFIWAIINSFLIEECRYSKTIDEELTKPISKAKNTNESPKALLINIQALEEVDWKKDLPLTYSLISCPLLWPFLGAYKNKKGENRLDLFDEIKKLLSDFEAFGEFEAITKNIEASQLKISALPIMGCFTK